MMTVKSLNMSNNYRSYNIVESLLLMFIFNHIFNHIQTIIYFYHMFLFMFKNVE